MRKWFTTLLFFLLVGIGIGHVAWSWGPRWGRGTSNTSVISFQGEIVKIEKLPGPGRWGNTWVVVDVTDETGKTVKFGIGPEWWSVPRELQEGVNIKISGIKPPCWSFRGVPYFLTCTMSFPEESGKVYNLRPCANWNNDLYQNDNLYKE
jgi:hypothetical protein